MLKDFFYSYLLFDKIQNILAKLPNQIKKKLSLFYFFYNIYYTNFNL